MNPPTFTKSGSKAASPVKLDRKLFGVEVENHELLRKAYLSNLANKRQVGAITKKRGQVRGGGRKPIQQKGTGNARVGSTRNPLWRGGGVAFGPTGQENYSIILSKKSKRIALKQALSLAASEKRLIIIDSFSVASGKTKDAAKLMDKIQAKGNMLLVLDTYSNENSQPFRNLKGVSLITAKNLNVYDVMNTDIIVFEKAALQTLSDTFGDSK